ncbi:YidC/Oxa1 family membrane protein insertase [Dehalobacter sp. DCM]|uniref:YidC/Oxa1 family membrane protein insertase n=1 Tax=Dehalobacter sp. DCM TaxID=2907827 RepID=UPI00308148F8|nr:YidC/Oxa1 family membrane protein insertase [Dehalobacter sp. DCM]
MDIIYQGMAEILRWLFELSSMIGLPYWGMAIILFTIIIKLILYPLTWKQTVSMRKMQELQPKMAQLQKKYANDKQMLNQKTMEMYSEEKVNPYSGCLPILVQLPILWIFYRTLANFPYGTGEAVTFLGFNITQAYGFQLSWHLILPIIAGLTSYVMSKVSMSMNKQQTKPGAKKDAQQAAADSTQKMMLYFMPIFMAYIVITLPSGLGFYIVTMNIVSILQTVYIYKKLDQQKQKAASGD